jgi:hypothetical protein
MLKPNFIPKTSVKAGDKTVLGTVTEDPKISPSGKTMTITVKTHRGTDFTDRVSALGNMAVFTDDADV